MQTAPWHQKLWHVLRKTVGAAFDYRITGMSAEAAFFAILSLPPLIFGLAGSVGFIARRFDPEAIVTFRDQVLTLAGRAFQPDVVDSIVAPTLDEVLFTGRFEFVSVGFLIALWSGSRVVNVFIDTITITYGMAGERGVVRQRALSVGAYVVFITLGMVLFPLVLAGPDIISALLPASMDWLTALYWPVVLIASVALMATIYHLAVPIRHRWSDDLPGAALAVLWWVVGSALLRMFLGYSVGSTSIYGPLSAPIAVLLWLYLMSMAILVGAALNAAFAEVFGITGTPLAQTVSEKQVRRDADDSPAT
ncbi:YihY/virulence factor BrkB family protein [Enemella sp. A6]|uniref:YihY/virulence factor BrkB family protein n=1 Tax=Enemella sp. A6 TaxID=3440152 RepID=UPI003EB8946E